MANDLNQCQFIGRLTKNPELSTYGNDGARCNFTIACNSFHNGENKAEFIPVVAFGNIARNINQFLTKGSQCFLSGKFQTRSWDKDDGTKAYKTEIVAFNVQFLSGAQDSAGNRGQAPAAENSGQYTGRPVPAPQAPQQAAYPKTPDYEDDLPF